MDRYPTIEKIVNDARARIQVTKEELDEARKRRAAIAAALRKEFPGSRSYVNGSVAHGDALTPLTDVDLGVVISNFDGAYGPGKKGPAELQERAAAAIRRELASEYGDLRIEFRGRKRSILVRFRDPIRQGLPDFTADVITAIDYPESRGLYIPRYNSWDRSDPEEHTRLITVANAQTRSTYARTVRLLKHWNRRNGMMLCSWNIKALALYCVTTEDALISSMRNWFKYAIVELKKGETEDPAHVADKPIKLNAPRGQVVKKLEEALGKLEKAIVYDLSGYPVLAHKELADLFNDPNMLPAPPRDAVLREGARFHTAPVGKPSLAFGAPALITTGVTPAVAATPVRSWAP
jgi:predicted nucleotidyltransferase